MRSIADAARLLAMADSILALVPIASAIGFGAPLSVDERMAASLGLHAGAGALLANGSGSLRALLIRLPDEQTPRVALPRVARQLAARTPHLLWLVLAVHQPTGTTAIACWSDTRAPVRLAALLADHRRVLDSDAETLLSLAASSRDAPDVLIHARWYDLLGREALTRRFYRSLEGTVVTMAESLPVRLTMADRRELALLNLSRLLFLAFLETKGWLDGDRGFLTNGFDAAMLGGGGYHRRVLLPLFFGTLNTPAARRAAAARAFGRVPFLNGGLFARTPLERRARGAVISDHALGGVFGDLLRRYRFTAREDSTGWSEAAIDPEMLGKAFESLMSSDERRATGAFYTPQTLVELVAGTAVREAAIDAAIAPGGIEHLMTGGSADPSDAAALRVSLGAMRLLDPACGSGAFLVHALEMIAGLLVRAGDVRPLAEVRRQVLTTSIFGVDVNPVAVWLCELRLWLSMVIESTATDPARVPPLPNLDHHIRVGDALSGSFVRAMTGGRTLTSLRGRYARAVGARKRTLARALDREERAHAVAAITHQLDVATATRRELLAAVRSRDLFGDRHHPLTESKGALDECRKRVRSLRGQRRALTTGGALPFSWNGHFSDVLAAGGFSVVLGNPPWIRAHGIPPAARAALRADYAVYRDAAWRAGAESGGVSHAFAAQVDVAALFVERSLALLRPGGVLALLLPSKLWRSLSGGGVRALLRERASLLAIEDWTTAPALFDAATYPSLVVARRADVPQPNEAAKPLHVTVHGRGSHAPRRWTQPIAALPFDDTRGSPWLLLPPDARAAFDRLTSAGQPLAMSVFERPRLGVKCGCNEAFLVEASPGREGVHPAVITVSSASRQGLIEHDRLRPCLRGEHVAAWRAPSANPTHVVWTHASDGAVLDRLPSHTRAWLAPWRRRLSRRSDARERAFWWMLFRTEGADARFPRVVWSDFGRVPRALVLPAGDSRVPLNTCYVSRCPTASDANALAALLNSALAAAWLNVLAEPARGGYHRYLGWTVARLPLPRDWVRARDTLAPLGASALDGAPPSDTALLDAVLFAYRLTRAEMEPLLCEPPTPLSSGQ